MLLRDFISVACKCNRSYIWSTLSCLCDQCFVTASWVCVCVWKLYLDFSYNRGSQPGGFAQGENFGGFQGEELRPQIDRLRLLECWSFSRFSWGNSSHSLVGQNVRAVLMRNHQLDTLGQCIPLPRHVLPVLRYGSGSLIGIATKIQSFVHWPIAYLPWKFALFCVKLLTNRQTATKT